MQLNEGESPEAAGHDASVLYTVDGFEGFYRREYQAVVALTYALCGRRAVAEELAQDAFVVAQRHWERVGRYDLPGAFVRRVAVNASVSYRRRVAAEAKALVRLAAGARPAIPALEPDAAGFWRLVRDLPRRQAQATALFYVEDRSTAEIAAILGCAEATVRVHLHRARSTLARRLGVPGGDPT